METHTKLYNQLCSMGNLTLAWRNARKGKTQQPNVMEFDRNITQNLLALNEELLNKTYKPRLLISFILRDPKTRIISKSDFRDRVVHHALINILRPIFEKMFIYDSCAGRIGKGTLFALKRFQHFIRKVSHNYKIVRNRFNDHSNIAGYCLKADIKHYFQEVNHNILVDILERKIKDADVIWLLRQILNNVANNNSIENKPNFIMKREREREITRTVKGMPLGNYTSQFFANVYLNELDQFVKHVLKVKYYIRYVDDFVILHESEEQLNIWKQEISRFLTEKLQITLHPDKSRIITLSQGVDFVGFRNFARFRLLRARNIRKMQRKINLFKQRKKGFSELMDSYQGWQAYARWANTYELREKIKRDIVDIIWERIVFEK